MRVRLHGILRKVVGVKEIILDYEELTLDKLFHYLTEHYKGLAHYIFKNGEKLSIRGIIILINGRHAMFQGGLKAVIKRGDVVDLIPPVHGG